MEFRVINTSHKKKCKRQEEFEARTKNTCDNGDAFLLIYFSHHVRPIFINIEAMEKQVVIINSLMSELIETFVAKIFSLCKWLVP